MIYLFDKDEKLIKIVRKSAVKTALQKYALTTERYVSDRLTVELKGLNADELEQVEYMAIQTLEDAHTYHYFYVAQKFSDELTTLIGVQSGIEELRKSPVFDKRPQNALARDVITDLLAGTNWQARFVGETTPHSTNFYYTSVFDALKKVCEVWDLEMQFFVEMNGNQIGARYIDFKQKIGQAVGKRVVYGHNALQILQEVERTNIFTALIGRGKGEETGDGYGRKITFENVVWSTTQGKPVNKPAGQKYLELPLMTRQYGIKNADGSMRPKIGFVDFSEEDDPEILIERTYRALVDAARPQLTLKTSSVYLRGVKVGDTIRVVRHDKKLDYDTRIFEITFNRLNNQSSDIKLGDRIGESNEAKAQTIADKAVEQFINNEFSNFVQNLPDYLPSADGFNNNWYGAEDPTVQYPGKVLINDIWFKPDPEHEGHKIMLRWTGEVWEEILRTYDSEALRDRIAEEIAQVNTAIENARQRAEQAMTLGEELAEDFDNLEIGGVNLALGTGDIRHVKADGTINYLWRMANSLSDYGIKEGHKMTISAELSLVSTKVQKLKLWADEYLAFFEHNTKVNGKLSVNELGLVGGSFIPDNFEWSYTPPTTSTSEAQTLVIRGLLRNYIVSGNKNFLETAEFLTDSLLNYYYPTPQIPTEPDPKWIPHWLVNVHGPFRSREWRIDGVANFVDGRATFESPEVLRVWSVRAKDATLQYDWSPSAPIVGTEYKIKNTNVLLGQSKVEIEIESSYTGQALVVYTAETGPIIEVGEKCEAYPVWRPLEKGEIACAVDTLPWAMDVFNLWFEITGDERWKMAIASTKSAIVEASSVTNVEYYLKAGKDSESVLINGVTSFSDRMPVETYTNDNGRIKIEYPESSGEANIGTWVGDKVEFSNSRWIGVKVGSEKPLKVKILIDEEGTYNPDKRWFSDIHLSGNGMETFDLYPSDFYRSDRVVWGSGYGKTTEGVAINSGKSLVSKETIIDSGKEVTRLTLVKGDEGGWLGWAQFMLGIWDYHLPFDLRYKTDDELNFVINANSTAHTLKLPKTNGEYSTITITGDSFDIPFTGDSYDSFIIEAVSQTSIIYIDYIGFLDKFDKEYLTNVGLRYSEPESATVYLEYIKPEPTRTPLRYSPYLMPFDFHLINYQFTSLRGAIYSGYQAPWIYQESIFPDVEEAVRENLQFLNDSQDAFFELQGQDGFFAPIYWWNYRDDYGNNEPDTFGIEGNWGKVWGGFQYRTISDVARVFIKDPTNQLAHDIFIRFLRGMENYWTDSIGNFPTAFNVGEPPHRDQLDAQMVSNFLRSLIYGWECSILTDEERALIKRLANKAFEFLEHYRIPVGLFESAVEGTWSPDKANETWFGYWGGELLDLLALAQTSTLFFDEDTEAVFEETGVQFYLNPPGTHLFDEPELVGEGKFSKTFRVSADAAALIMDEQRLGISLLNNSQSLIAIKKLKIEIGNKNTDYSKANEENVLYSQFSKIEKTIKGFKQTVQNTKADKTTVIQLADMWQTTTELVSGHTSQISSMGKDINLRVKTSELISQINVSSEDILIDSKMILLKGKTLAQQMEAIDGKFGTLFVSDGTFTKLNAGVIATNSITGDKISFDDALFNKMMTNTAKIKELFAKDAFITSVQAVTLSANQIEGGLIKATSGAMDINLNNAGIIFSEDAKIEFKSENNTLFRTKNGTSAFIHFRDDSYNGVYTAMGVNADNTGTQNDYASGRFAGVRVIRTNPNHYSGKTVDEIQLVADTVNFRHQYGVNNDYLRIQWDGGSRIDLIQFLRAVSNYLGISLV